MIATQMSVRSFSSLKGMAVVLAALLVLNADSRIVGAGRAAAAAGALSVTSDPVGAAVYVDGQYAGQTPLSRHGLAAGDHRVRLVKDGYLENGRIVRISTNRPTSVQVSLTRQVTSTAVVAGQVVRPPAPRPGATTQDTGGGGFSAKSFLIGAAAGLGGGGAAWYLFLHNRRPTPGAIAVSPTGTGMAGATTFTFVAQGANDRNGDSLTYDWTFGDGTSSSGQTVTHVYSSAGSFNVHLTVKDENTSASPPDVPVSVALGMGGTWSGGIEPGFGASFTVTPSQNGSALGGSATFGAPINTTANVTGSVTSLTYPAPVTFTTAAFTVPAFPGLTFNVSFDGVTNTAGSTMTGTIRTTSSNPSTFPEQSWTKTLSR